MAKSRSSRRSASKKVRRRRITRKQFRAFLAKEAEWKAAMEALTKANAWLAIARDKTQSFDERLRALHEADKTGAGLDSVKKLLAMWRSAGSVH